MSRRVLLLLVILLFSVSCATVPFLAPSPTATIEPLLTDRSWLTDEPCKAPCWYGLEPGKTTKGEALSKVNTLSFIDSGTIREEPWAGWDWKKKESLDATIIFYRCKHPDAICAALIFANGTLQSIYLYPNYQLTLGEVVTKLGNPDLVRASPISPETIDCQLELAWQTRQMAIIYYEKQVFLGRDLCRTFKQAGNKPPANLPVQWIWYETPKRVNTSLNTYSPWSGFSEP